MSKRKPHDDFSGYLAELRNKYSGGHTVISDCKRAVEEGIPLVANYIEEGGRYQVLCNEQWALSVLHKSPGGKRVYERSDDILYGVPLYRWRGTGELGERAFS